MSSEKCDENKNKSVGWDFVILELERKLRRQRNKTATVMAALYDARRLRDEGRPWPGEVAGTEGKSVPA